MVEEILPGLFRLKIPLPNSPLKDLNSYVLTSDERNLVIDTGFNRDECFEAMQTGLGVLGIDPAETDFLLTHMHSDHTGLVSRLATPQSKVYIGRIDARVFDSGIDWRPVAEYALNNGFERDELEQALQAHPGIKYKPRDLPPFTLLDDGDRVELGDFTLQVLLTPGHTRGHICLYDAARRVLISGDHILYDITPHIESWSFEFDSLRQYLDSLDRVRDLPVDIVLPGHRNTFADLAGRVDELKEHHRQRAQEVIDILDGSTMSAYRIAAAMTWDIRADSFEAFPVAQKWFAVGEALAHLRYLEGEGRVERLDGDKIALFRVRRA